MDGHIRSPDAVLDGNFGNLVHFEGYGLDTAGIAPDGTASPGLYWRPIYVGLYDPDTFERVPVLNDTSGENAVVIDLSELP